MSTYNLYILLYIYIFVAFNIVNIYRYFYSLILNFQYLHMFDFKFTKIYTCFDIHICNIQIFVCNFTSTNIHICFYICLIHWLMLKNLVLFIFVFLFGLHVYICIFWIYIYIFKHLYIYKNISIYTWYKYLYIYIYLYLPINIYICIYNLYICMSICIYVYMYTCKYVNM